MSKHQNILSFPAFAVMQPAMFGTIGMVFTAWQQAAETAHDTAAPQAERDAANKRMGQLWERALDIGAKSAPEVAALFIMANNSVSIDPDSFMESAWKLVHSGGAEVEIVRLYGIWRNLSEAIDRFDMDNDQLLGFGAIRQDIEEQIAAIPATTAKALAIKVDLFRHHLPQSTGGASLSADLAAITGVAERPE